MWPIDHDPANRTGKYVLNEDGEPVAEPDLMVWALWYETSPERSLLDTRVGVARVSTIFLGLDYDHSRTGPPVLWETMVFSPGSAFHCWCRRYTSKLDALAGHVLICELVERFDPVAAPRRLKKALQKLAANHPLRPGELRRVTRWSAQVAAFAHEHREP